MTQDQLFYEDVFEVAKAAIAHAGGAKKVSGILWPSKAPQQAHKELLDCLNRESPRKLCIEEFMAVLKMAREAGFHQAKHWIDSELGYQPTQPMDPVVERDRLAEELSKLNASVRAMTQAAERLNEQRLKSVKP